MVIRELMIAIGFKVDSEKLDKVNKGIDRMKRVGRGAETGVKRLRDENGKFIKEARSGLPKIGAEFKNLGSQAMTFAGILSAFATGALAGRFLISTISQFQQLRAQLVTIEQDEAKAEAAFARLQEFATTTPFELANVVDAFTKLRAVGLDPTNADLMAMGDIAAGMGKDIIEFSEAVVGATTGEMERLKAFGIVAKQNGDNITFIFKGKEKTIKKSAENISGYLYELGRENFAGGMERQMLTINGAFSNLMDNISVFADEVGKGGLADEINLFVRELTGAAGESMGLARILGKVLGYAVRGLREGFRFLKDNIKTVTAVMALFAAKLAITAVASMTRALISMAAGFSLSTAGIWLSVAALILFAALIEDIVGFFGGKDSMIGDTLKDVFGVTGPEAVNALKLALSGLVFALVGVLALMNAPLALVMGLIAAAVLLVAEWATVKQAFINMFSEIYDFVGNLFGLILLSVYQFFENMGIAVGEKAASIWFPLEDAWHNAIARMRAIFDTLKTYISNGISAILSTIASIPQRLSSLPGISTILEIGSDIRGLLPQGAQTPQVDAQRRMNEVTNNSRRSATNVTAPVTINVASNGGDSGSLVSDIESKIGDAIASMFGRAAADYEGALE